jgi:hypothetical protein
MMGRSYSTEQISLTTHLISCVFSLLTLNSILQKYVIHSELIGCPLLESHGLSWLSGCDGCCRSDSCVVNKHGSENFRTQLITLSYKNNDAFQFTSPKSDREIVLVCPPL